LGHGCRVSRRVGERQISRYSRAAAQSSPGSSPKDSDRLDPQNFPALIRSHRVIRGKGKNLSKKIAPISKQRQGKKKLPPDLKKGGSYRTGVTCVSPTLKPFLPMPQNDRHIPVCNKLYAGYQQIFQKNLNFFWNMKKRGISADL
jgi:hypothetical protein